MVPSGRTRSSPRPRDGHSVTLGVHLSPTSRGGSQFMHTLQPGDPIELTAPLQNFPLRIGAPRYVLLAGGIGITAMAAMAAVLRRVGAEYHSSTSAQSYCDGVSAGTACRCTVSGWQGTLTTRVPDSCPDLVGRVDEVTELYMCGPIRLMDAVRRMGRTRDLPRPNLRYETFGNSGWFEAEEFAVTIPDSASRPSFGPATRCSTLSSEPART